MKYPNEHPMNCTEELEHLEEYYPRQIMNAQLNGAWRDMARIGMELGLNEADISPDAIVNTIAKLKDENRSLKQMLKLPLDNGEK
jgi:hypothetical protein